MGTIWQSTKNIFLLLATAIAVGSAVTITVLGIGFTPVLSQSMSPVLTTGEIVITKPMPKNQIEIGDVAILPIPNDSGQRFLHRIIEVQQMNGEVLVRTQGDSNASPDPWTLQIDSQNVPIVIASIPKLGLVSSFFQTPSLRLSLGLAIVLLSLFGIFRAMQDVYRTTKHRSATVSPKDYEATIRNTGSRIP